MSEFENPPIRILETMEDVRAAIAEAPDRGHICGLKGLDAYRIKSVWLVSLIDEIVAGGKYPYNADVKKLAEQRLGFPPKTYAQYSQEGDALSTLVYNAQKFRRSDNFERQGYEPFTEEVLERAHRTGQAIEFYASGIMGDSIHRLNVRQIGERLYAMKPKKRKMYVPPQGQPVRLVEPKEVTP